jgi:hypothetical protein
MSFKKTNLAVAVGMLAGSMGAMAADTAALEKQIKMMQEQLNAMQAELKAVKDAEPAQEKKIQSIEAAAKEPVKQLEDRVAKVEQSKAMRPTRPGNEIFFRGGYASLGDDRGGGAFTDIFGANTLVGSPAPDTLNNNDSGWYVGAGFDFELTDNTWGLFPGLAVDAELMAEFSHMNSGETLLVVPSAECTLALDALTATPGNLTNCLITGTNNLNQLTVSASPKLKLWPDSKFQPWIIPVGLDFRVISPPSDSSAYLDVGAQFGAGAELEIIPGIKVGGDFRYHLAAGLTNPDYSAATEAAIRGLGLTVDEPNNDYWTAGAYLGIGF